MEKFKFTLIDIAKWHNQAIENFKVHGEILELHRKSKKQGYKIIESTVIKDGKGYIIIEPNTITNKKLYLKLKDERDSLIKIKHLLLELKKSSVISGHLKDFNSIENEINESWNSLTIDTQNKFKEHLKHNVALPNKTNKHQLSIKEIALKYVYEGIQVTRKNCNKLIIPFGHHSGEKLFQYYTHFCSASNRKGKPINCTPTTLKNQIKRIEKVIKILPKEKKK